MGSQYLNTALLRALLGTTAQGMASTPNTNLSSLSSDDSLDEYLFVRGTGLSDPTCSGVVERRKLFELNKRLG